MSEACALLVIDMQAGLLHGPQTPHAKASLIDHTRQLMARAREQQVPLFFAQHTGPEGSPIAAGSDFWQIAPRVPATGKRSLFQ